MHREPTWWLWRFPTEKEKIQLIQILGEHNFEYGQKQPHGNQNAIAWPYLDVNETVDDGKKLLIEMLLGDAVVNDWLSAY